MLKTYFQKKNPIISVLIFNCVDVEWEELDGNQSIKEFLHFLNFKHKIKYCNLNINNDDICLKKEYYTKLGNYVKDYNSLTIKIYY